MITDPQKIEFIPEPVQVQQEIETPISQIGYTERPLNARTQTNNRYLDSVSFGWVATVTSMWLSYVIFSQDVEVWNYNRNVWNSITIPVQGTYLINWDSLVSSASWIWQVRIVIEKNGTTDIKVVYAMAEHWTTIPISTTYNFVKGDYIRIYIDNSSSDSIDVVVNLTIVKLS